MGAIVHTPLPRKRGVHVSFGHRYTMVVKRALAIPPGNSKMSKGILGPLTELYGAGPEYPTKLWENCKAQTDDIGTLDLSRKWAVVASYSDQGHGAADGHQAESAIFAQQGYDQLEEIGLEYVSETVRRWFRKYGFRKGGSPHQAVSFRGHPRSILACNEVSTGEIVCVNQSDSRKLPECAFPPLPPGIKI